MCLQQISRTAATLTLTLIISACPALDDDPVLPTRSCPALAESIGAELSAMTSVNGRQWESIDHTKLKLGMSNNSSTELFLFGYKADDLETSGTEAAPCDGNNEVFGIEDPAPFFNANEPPGQSSGGGLVMLFPPDFNPNFPDGSKVPLVTRGKLPLAIVPYDIAEHIPVGTPGPNHLKGFLSDPTNLAVILTHETFHQYQVRFTEPQGYDRDLESCKDNAEFVDLISNELEDWEEIEELIGDQGTPSVEDVKAKLKEILARRDASTGNTAECLGRVEYGEWLEGTPTYFANNLARKGGQPVDYRAVYESFSTQNPLLFAEGREVFYVTGAIACDALDVVTNPGQWQGKIEAGFTPADVLRELLQ